MRALLATLPYKIKQDAETQVYREYLVRAVRILTENSAIPAAYYSNGEKGVYLKEDLMDVIGANERPRKQYEKGGAIAKVKAKLR